MVPNVVVCMLICICLYAFVHLGWHKNEKMGRVFFGIVITHNDHPSYVKHVLGSNYVLFTLLGYWLCAGGGGEGCLAMEL